MQEFVRVDEGVQDFVLGFGEGAVVRVAIGFGHSPSTIAASR